MTETITLADHRIVGTLGLPRHGYGVRVAMHEVQLRDGSMHCFHRVLDGGLPSQRLRALRMADGRTYRLVDLKHLAATLADELCTCADRDMPGLVNFTLRGIYPTSQALRRVVDERCQLVGVPQTLRALVGGVAGAQFDALAGQGRGA